MKKIYLLPILLMLSNLIYSQSNCYCGDLYDEINQVPDTIINLNNTPAFAICGYFGKEYISEFTITKCGEKEILKFYDATLTYKIRSSGDTLILIEDKWLPINNFQEFKRIPWAEDIYYSKEDKVIHERRIIYKAPFIKISEDFYSEWKNEIKDDWSANHKLIAWTFLLSLNDKKVYDNYFSKYLDVFKLGGANAEYYMTLSKMYKEYSE
jgi:hypothetical protein